MNISVMIPTRGRAEGLVNAITKMEHFATNPTHVEYLLKKDTDDPIPISNNASDRVTILNSNRLAGYQSLNHFYNAMAALSRGKWLWLFNDDAWTETPGWDEKIMAYGDGDKVAKVLTPFTEWPNAPDQAHYEEYHKVWQPNFPLISRKLYEASGHFSMSYANDSWWLDICGIIPDLRQDVREITVFHTYQREGMKPVALNGEAPAGSDPFNHSGARMQQLVKLDAERIKAVLAMEETI